MLAGNIKKVCLKKIILSLFFFNHCHSYIAVHFTEMFFITCVLIINLVLLHSKFDLNVKDQTFSLTPEMLSVKRYQKTVHGMLINVSMYLGQFSVVWVGHGTR